MKSKKTLIMCNSAFQIIAAVRISHSLLDESEVDLVITDQLANNLVIKNRIHSAGFFTNIYTITAKDYDWKNWKFTWMCFFFKRELLNRFLELEKRHYDAFYFANTGTGSISSCLASFLKQRDNAQLCMYEDGFASYGPTYKSEFEKLSCGNLKYKLLYGIKKSALYYVDKYYVSCPEILSDWNFQFEILEIPPLKEDLIAVLNRIYDYGHCKDKYEEKYIFFEESYYADGIGVDDIAIVNRIANIIGKENILVKIHPRNPKNRFAELGYKTNTDTSVPWEVIALNIDITSKVLMTIASGSSITSYFVSNRQAKKSILLYDMDFIDKETLTPTLPVFDKICRGNSYFVYPHNWDEFINAVKVEDIYEK